MATHWPYHPSQCRRCQAFVPLPMLEQDLRAQILELVRGGRGGAAFQLLVANSDLKLEQAKSFVFHLTKVPGTCHRCKAMLQTADAHCGRCHSLNLDW